MGGAPRVRQDVLIGLGRGLGFRLQLLGLGQVGLAAGRAFLEHIGDARQGQLRHQQVKRDEGDGQPDELGQIAGDVKLRHRPASS